MDNAEIKRRLEALEAVAHKPQPVVTRAEFERWCACVESRLNRLEVGWSPAVEGDEEGRDDG